MITIHTKNVFTLTPYGCTMIQNIIHSNYTEKLANKYILRKNEAINATQFFHEFGSNDDFTYGTSAGISAKFNLNAKKMTLDCFASGGMTGLTFDETDVTGYPKNAEDNTINFTIKFVKTLINHGIILERKSDINTPFPDLRLIELDKLNKKIDDCSHKDIYLTSHRDYLKQQLKDISDEISDNAIEKLKVMDRKYQLQVDLQNNPPKNEY